MPKLVYWWQMGLENGCAEPMGQTFLASTAWTTWAERGCYKENDGPAALWRPHKPVCASLRWVFTRQGYAPIFSMFRPGWAGLGLFATYKLDNISLSFHIFPPTTLRPDQGSQIILYKTSLVAILKFW